MMKIEPLTPPENDPIELGSDLENFLALKEESPREDKKKSEENTGFKAKWKKFIRATKLAGNREERTPLRERMRGHLVLYNVGQVRGVLKGIYEGVGSIVNPRSALNQLSVTRLHQEIPKLGNKTLDWGIRYMEADWEKRGEMAGQETVRKGLWFIHVRNLFLGTKKLISKTTKKLNL